MTTGTVGILTTGGDAPGINAAIAEVVQQATRRGKKTFGFLDGWKGLYEGKYQELSPSDTSRWFDEAGTILGCGAFNPWEHTDFIPKIMHHYKGLGIEGLIVVGGDTSIGVANRIYDSCAHLGMRLVFIPKTIDNDIPGIKYAIGFYTAVNRVREYVRGMRSSAESQHRIYVLETMGRSSGWLALYGGVVGGADAILIPEVPFDLEKLFALLAQRYEQRHASIVVVAEALKDSLLDLIRSNHPLTHNIPKITRQKLLSAAHEAQQTANEFGEVRLAGFASNILASIIKTHVDASVSADVIGHIQRGWMVSSYDLHLAQKLGNCAVHALLDKNSSGVFITNSTRGARAIALDKARGMRRVPDYEWRGVPAIEIVHSKNGIH